MPSYRCDSCGHSTARLHDVWRTQPYPSVDREVCDTCADTLGIVRTTEDNHA